MCKGVDTPCARVVGRAAVIVVIAVALAGVSVADDVAERPEIVDVRAPSRLPVGVAGEIRLIYRASRANVVAVVQAVEDLDGSGVRRSTRQREFGVVARAFGREAGELAVPFSFGTTGWKRITLTLVTDEREESEPTAVEIEVIP